MMADAELRTLAEDIAANGLQEPVTLYDDPDLGTLLLDGRNRLAACQLVGVPPISERYHGSDPVGFVVSKNLYRRHLTPGQKAAIAHDLLPFFAHEARERQRDAARRSAGQRPRDVRGRLTQMVEALPTPGQKKMTARDQAGRALGISGRSVATFSKLAREDPDLADQVRVGTLELHRAGAILRSRQAEAARMKAARQDARRSGSALTVDIRHGDFREVLADLRDVDCIITDPWYHKRHLPLMGDLAAWADRVLAPEGVLAVLVGKMYLPQVYKLLDGHRPYRWTACYLLPGAGGYVFPRNVVSKWKALLIYGGGATTIDDDVISCEGTHVAAKALHPFGQDLTGFSAIVERLTKPGQTVCDPMAGSGTTLVAAHTLGRHVIGCDVSDESVETMRRRLGMSSS